MRMPQLTELLVIDLTHVLNGPFGTTILTDLGARDQDRAARPPGRRAAPAN
jgi:hypothetical protein